MFLIAAHGGAGTGAVLHSWALGTEGAVRALGTVGAVPWYVTGVIAVYYSPPPLLPIREQGAAY